MDYTRLFIFADELSRQISHFLPSQYNSIFQVPDESNFVPNKTVSPNTGNYRPASKSLIAVKARMYQKQPPKVDYVPGSDIAVLYFEGILINPRTANIKKDLKVRATINEQNGWFQFVPKFESPYSHFSSISAIFGQTVAGYFKID